MSLSQQKTVGEKEGLKKSRFKFILAEAEMALLQRKIKENSNTNVLRLILPVSMTRTISAYYGIGAVLGERERVSKGEEAMNRENGFPNYTTAGIFRLCEFCFMAAGTGRRA